jgi:2-polyprenyl-6-methoxyphenol hydroxylase-like FAD-dependent oxidoreductase
MDVVVVGAGLGGLAAAVALRRTGHTVTVLERGAEIRETGAGIGLMPNGVRALDALGVGGPVRERDTPLPTGGGMRDRHGRPLLTVDQAAIEARAGAPLVVVDRTWLHRLLAAALPAGVVRTGTTIDAVRDDGRRVHLETRAVHDDRLTHSVGDRRPGHHAPGDHAADRVSADLVVGADGAGSRLRTALFPEHPGLEGSGEYAARALVPAGLGVEPVSGELLDHRTGERFGCMLLADGRTYWYATWSATRAYPGEPVARLAALRTAFADWHPTVGALLAATDPAALHVAETVRLRVPLPALAVGHVALLGDAAHAMTPDLGQGGCQAFEDAVALGRVLDDADPADVPAALARYDALRRPRTTALQRQARQINRLLRLHGPAGRLRDAMLRAVPQPLATSALARQFAFDTVRA